MTAGLPKIQGTIATVTALLILSLTAVAQDNPLEPTLQSVIDQIETCTTITQDQQTLLVEAFATAVTAQIVTPDQAIALLGAAALESATDETNAASTVDGLSSILVDLTEGLLDYEGAIAKLTDASPEEEPLDPVTPDGIRNAIGNAASQEGIDTEAVDATLAAAERLIAAGIPPGIVLRTVKDAFRDGSDAVEWLDQLESLIADGTSPGNAANAVADKGQNRHREEELNQNENQEPNEEPETEQESNTNSGRAAQQSTNEKKDSGKSQGKDKD